MVLIWLMMVNNNLVGGFNHLENMKVNGKDDIPYLKWKINNVWNHQPVMCFFAVTKTKHAWIEKHGYSWKEIHRNYITIYNLGSYAKIHMDIWNNVHN